MERTTETDAKDQSSSPSSPTFAEFVDTVDGAEAARLWIAIFAGAAYLLTEGHRHQAWSVCKGLATFWILFFFVCLIVPLMDRVCYMVVWSLCLMVRVFDAVSFKGPRWLLRKRLAAVSAFWTATGLQLAVLATGGFCAQRSWAEQAKLNRPVQFGPAVLSKLHLKQTPHELYRELNGKVLPLISTSESLRRTLRQEHRLPL